MDNNILEVWEKLEAMKAPYEKRDIALALWADVACQRELPRVVVFKDEGPEEVAKKLTFMMRTPTGKTENQLPGMAGYVRQLGKILGDQGHSGASAGFVTCNVLGEALGKRDWRIYVDEGRNYIQYSDAITRALQEQFGQEWIGKARKKVPEFFKFLDAGERVAERVGAHRLEVKPETVARGVRQVKMRRITFGGFGAIEKEIAALNENIRGDNARTLEMGDGEELIMPGFLKEDTHAGGLLVDNAKNFVEGSALHVEVIGDGFGDASYAMAVASFGRAKELGIPIFACVKEKRKANHPVYAERFLKLVDPAHIRRYKEVYELTGQVEAIYQVTFTGVPTHEEQHQQWRDARAELVAKTFGRDELLRTDNDRKGKDLQKVAAKVRT